jgi:replicative DNA helicase
MPAVKPIPAPDFLYLPSRAARVATAEFMRRQDAPGRINWGIPAMDDYLVPELPGELITVLGRPGMCKTSCLLAKARWAAASWVKTSGGCVVYATWETLIEEAVAVLAAPLSGFTLENIGRGTLDAGQLQGVVDAATGLLDSGLVFFGRSLESPPGRIPTLDDLEQALLDLYERNLPPRLLLIDYLQRIPTSGKQRSDADMGARVSANLDRCKDLAIQYKVPCDVAVQARREVDDYSKLKLPTMKDGQWSSNIEQTSDKVLGFTRPILYLAEGSEIRREGLTYRVGSRTLVAKVLKQRWGPSGDKAFILDFDPRTCSISPQEAIGETEAEDAF